MSGQIAHYRLSGYIGRGAMAVVYLAQDQRTGGNVALKVVAPELAGDAAFRSRFLHESRMAASISHPHIIPIYDADEAAGNLYVAMGYVQGGDARSLLNRHGPLPVDWAWTIIAGVASALDAAHAHGLIHGDRLGGAHRSLLSIRTVVLGHISEKILAILQSEVKRLSGRSQGSLAESDLVKIIKGLAHHVVQLRLPRLLVSR